MAHHDTHERPCPHCGERMSATAPKCLNCGRLVDEEEDDDSPIHPRMIWTLAAIVVGLVAVIGAFMILSD